MQEDVVTLADGRQVMFRPLAAGDEALIATAIRTASERTLRHRFFAPVRELASGELHRLLTIDPAREFCLVGETAAPRRIVCGARYVRLERSGAAEIALTVHDDFQRQGLGRELLRRLMARGRADGIRVFTAEVLGENTAMLNLLRRLVPERRVNCSRGVCHVEWELAAPV